MARRATQATNAKSEPIEHTRPERVIFLARGGTVGKHEQATRKQSAMGELAGGGRLSGIVYRLCGLVVLVPGHKPWHYVWGWLVPGHKP